MDAHLEEDKYDSDVHAIDQLFRMAIASKGVSEFSEFMEFVARNRRYSSYNMGLAKLQRPGAVIVLSPRDWYSRDREIVDGSVPIIILQPYGPVMGVFDLADTMGPPLDDSLTFEPFPAQGFVSDKQFISIITGVRTKDRIHVEFVEYGYLMAGMATATHYTDQSMTVPGISEDVRYLVRVSSNLSRAAQFATLAHELAHIYCGHLGAKPKDRWPDRQNKLTHPQRELEAEAASYLVCRRYGIETSSAKYLSEIVSEDDLNAISIHVVLRAADRIQQRIINRYKREDMATTHSQLMQTVFSERESVSPGLISLDPPDGGVPIDKPEGEKPLTPQEIEGIFAGEGEPKNPKLPTDEDIERLFDDNDNDDKDLDEDESSSLWDDDIEKLL